jgi:hypothetical protein
MGLVAVGAVVLLLLVAAGARGAPAPTQRVVLIPPYSGASAYTSEGTDVVACGHAAVPVRPFFHAARAAVGFDVTAGSHICSQYPSSGFASATVTVSVPLPAGVTGSTVVVRWTMDYQVQAHIGSMVCLLPVNVSYSDCYVYASAEIYPTLYLYDETSGVAYFPSTALPFESVQATVENWCSNGTCGAIYSPGGHSSGDLRVVTAIPITGFNASTTGLNASHTYELVWSLGGWVDCFDSWYDATLSGTGFAASVTLAGPGEGAHLSSITVR